MTLLQSALKHYKALRKDKTSDYVCRRHLWKLAYWSAREERSAAA